MPSKVFIGEEVEMKNILGYVNKFIENEDWSINAVGLCTVNQKLYTKMIVTCLIILQIILLIFTKDY